MTCLDREAIARAASGEGDADAHLVACAECRAKVAAHAELRAELRALRAEPLASARLAAIGAEVMARADLPARRSGWLVGGAVLAAAAAVAVLALRESPRAALAVPNASPMVAVATELRSASAAHEPALLAASAAPAPRDVATAPKLARLSPEAGADLARDRTAAIDTVSLREGAITLDARGAGATEVVARDATVRAAGAKVRVVARGGAIVSVTVFAGSVEIAAGGAIVRVEAGHVWEPAAPTAADPARASWTAFRTGWTALREGRNTDAIAAFDTATASAVAEDAAYWAAVATQRAGDRRAALRRFTAFAQQFPASPHADAARAATKLLAEP